jgi:hypothetical protein
MGMPFVVVLEVLFLALVRSTDRTLDLLAKDGIVVACKRLVIDLKGSWA